MAEVETKEKKPRASLSRRSWALHRTRQNHWMALAEHGTQPEEVLIPTYWAFIATDLRPYDQISVCCEDNSWYGDLLVVGCDRTRAVVQWLPGFPLNLTEQQVTREDLARFTVKWRGPKGHSVIVKDTNQVLKDEFIRADDAWAWLREHLRSQ